MDLEIGESQGEDVGGTSSLGLPESQGQGVCKKVVELALGKVEWLAKSASEPLMISLLAFPLNEPKASFHFSLNLISFQFNCLWH